MSAAAVFVSVVSLWEIGIKHHQLARRPSSMRRSAKAALSDFIEAELQLLEFTVAHSLAIDDVPRIHGDPFDRLLVAQAKSEPLHLLTHDRQLAAYTDLVILF